ncbi:MAG: hypothetical protein JNL74_22955 [Fibrobacteres bacterium]|nr:hypothetical protein [Fibrobacterota bacterium]
MNNQLCSLSKSHYHEILSQIKSTFAVVPFCKSDITATRKKPTLILRHDIDSSLHNALVMARMENELGIESTYFVQLHCDYYSSLTIEGISLIRSLRDLGHEIGLHYDPVYYNTLGISFEKGVSQDIEILEAIIERPLLSVSRHLPLLGGQKESLPSKIKFNAMNPDYINGKYKYLSDSNGVFREGCFCSHLNNLKDYCFLVHPIWWTTDGDDWKSKLRTQADNDCVLVRTRIENKIDQYSAILEKRKEYDAQLMQKLKQDAKS